MSGRRKERGRGENERGWKIRIEDERRKKNRGGWEEKIETGEEEVRERIRRKMGEYGKRKKWGSIEKKTRDSRRREEEWGMDRRKMGEDGKRK